MLRKAVPTGAVTESHADPITCARTQSFHWRRKRWIGFAVLAATVAAMIWCGKPYSQGAVFPHEQRVIDFATAAAVRHPIHSNSIGLMDKVKLDAFSEQCAEQHYRNTYPNVAAMIVNRTFPSGKAHYLHLASSALIANHKRRTEAERVDYLCPSNCIALFQMNLSFWTTQQLTNECTTCTKYDREATYLKNYPDVARIVKAGREVSGLEHFRKWGKAEGRSDSCLERFVDPNPGDGPGCKQIVSDFIKTTSSVVSTWPLSGIPRSPLQKFFGSKTCKAVLLIEGTDHIWLDYTLRVHRRYTGPDWMFYLVGPRVMAQKWRARYKNQALVTVVELPDYFGDLSDYPAG